jgi:hypothetical protein
MLIVCVPYNVWRQITVAGPDPHVHVFILGLCQTDATVSDDNDTTDVTMMTIFVTSWCERSAGDNVTEFDLAATDSHDPRQPRVVYGYTAVWVVAS